MEMRASLRVGLAGNARFGRRHFQTEAAVAGAAVQSKTGLCTLAFKPLSRRLGKGVNRF
jgi:hypothetical protein